MQVDGINYVVQHEAPWGGKQERVLVWQGEELLVATAVVHTDTEQITVAYSDGSENDADYWAYTSAPDADTAIENLANWMVATSY